MCDNLFVNQVYLRPRLEGSAALHANSGAAHIGGRTDGASERLAGQRRGLAEIVEIGEVNHLLAIGCDRNRTDRSVHLAQP